MFVSYVLATQNNNMTSNNISEVCQKFENSHVELDKMVAEFNYKAKEWGRSLPMPPVAEMKREQNELKLR
jgi:hypothetical protein